MRHDYTSGIAIAIDDSSQVGEARRTAGAMATDAGLSETETGRVALIASEAASNIVKHASHGELILRSMVGSAPAVDIIAIDAGPGMADVDRAFRDGFSTAGSSGTGLGAISRLATTFDIFTRPGGGTVIAARVEGARRDATRPPSVLEIGVARVAKRGEMECGDDWGVVCDGEGHAMLTVADGLGHGTAAAGAARRAVAAAEERGVGQPAVVLADVHAALRPTRGAAVAIAVLDTGTASLRYAGVGNISARLVGTGESRSLVSQNGIAGHELRKSQEYSYDWPRHMLLVVHSDGVSARWDLGSYPGLIARHPSVVAGVLYRDFSRGRDDALVLVVRVAA